MSGDFERWNNRPVHHAPAPEHDLYSAQYQRYLSGKRIFWRMVWLAVAVYVVIKVLEHWHR